MFDLLDTKSFMDNVHGYIRIPKLFVQHIIDSNEFQRLRGIEQTGMKILYPSARHDRFSHSLGVYHLGSIAVDFLLNNFKDSPHWKIRSNNTRYVFWAKNKLLFLIACLLHDIGHSPFSHSLERFYNIDPGSDLFAALGNDLKLENQIFELSKCSEHERMSAEIIISSESLWRIRIKTIFDGLITEKYPEAVETAEGEYDKPFPTLADDSLNEEDFHFIARMILGIKYKNPKPELQVKNCFIELLNGNIDVDKLDYIARDTKMSGIGNVTLDMDRLLGALTIIPTTIYSDYTFDKAPPKKKVILRKLEIEQSKQVKIIGELDRELIITKGLVSVPCDACISLSPAEGVTGGDISYKEATFTADSEVFVNNSKLSTKEAHPDEIYLEKSDGKSLLELKKAIVKETGVKKFDFTISESKSHRFTINSSNRSAVILDAQASMVNSRFSGTIEGTVKCVEIPRDELSNIDKFPDKKYYTAFSLGFRKSAINLISNVSDARNYLYLWIYSHHKVIYYANYLIIELSRLALPIVLNKSLQDEMTEKVMDSANGYMLDETYLLSQIRTVILDNKADDYLIDLFTQLSTRKYRKSLYKSLAEFDLYFDAFTLEQKNKIRDILDTMSKEPVYDVTDKHKTANVKMLKYGFIKDNILCKISY
jgi:HD superfamily phosphohydrolase